MENYEENAALAEAVTRKMAEYFVLMWSGRAFIEGREDEERIPEDRLHELCRATQIRIVKSGNQINSLEDFYEPLEAVWMELEAGKEW